MSVTGIFILIAGLTCHGQNCHDTRHHACPWCVEYFDNADALYTHIRNKHYFECTICYNISHTAEDLDEHIKETHGGLQPSEQELQVQKRGEERLECEEWKKAKAKAKAEARQTEYFPCKEVCGRIQHEERTRQAHNGQAHLRL